MVVAVAYWLLKSKGEEEKPAPAPMAVSVVALQETDVSQIVELPGRITPFRVSDVRPQVDGILKRRLFTEGADVKAGEPLYQIDPALYEATYNSTRADLLRAEANAKSTNAKLGRYGKLVKLDAVSKQDYDDIRATAEQARADVAVAKAAVETARINLDYTRVRAPIAGRIGKSNWTEGALVAAKQEQPLAVITQLDPIYIDLTQSDREAQSLRSQMQGTPNIPVALVAEGGKETGAQGKIEFSDITIDPTTGSVQMRAIFPNTDHALLPGMFVRARLTFASGRGLLVPQQAAVRSADGTASAWVVGPDNKVQPVKLSIERAVGSHWLVNSGVKAGDVIVMEGFQKITPGAVVKPQPHAPQQPAPAPASP